jgi:hypothetical protein
MSDLLARRSFGPANKRGAISNRTGLRLLLPPEPATGGYKPISDVDSCHGGYVSLNLSFPDDQMLRIGRCLK